jgi:hypothetical protein
VKSRHVEGLFRIVEPLVIRWLAAGVHTPASLVEIAAELGDHCRSHRSAFFVRHLDVRLGETDRRRWSGDPKRPRRHTQQEFHVPLDERAEGADV